ncbi:hypothetical protein BHE17_11965 [Planococcus maritimus]|uniref:glycosyltransferase family 4 protein n=1 Tax=Planococcus maritimus TaxID=192421 RepID=UPI00084C279F|nr:glycosyltransferase family 4 protein [Planococcus maritimus]OED33127.1 hypothetical protein BHE17_11965 [Planococcus maritimus]
MKKILIISTVSRQFYLFEQGNIEVLNELGYEVHAAANFSDSNKRLSELDIVKHHFNIERSPISINNFKAYQELKTIIRNENFDIIHCHSPMGGVLARLAAKALNYSKVIYTAHGFHFYKGAPKLNWFVYFQVEKFLSQFTEMLITINKEDYINSKSFKANRIAYVPGIGVDTSKFKRRTKIRQEKREELKITDDKVVLLSIGELINRKNFETTIRAISEIREENLVYLICGTGELENSLKSLVKELSLENTVKFLGYRNDIPDICSASDIFLFPSYQEGLPVSVMEAMSSKLPVVCSNIRGNVDLIENGKGGFLLNPTDIQGYSKRIKELTKDRNLRSKMGELNEINVRAYDKKIIKNEMREIYSSFDREFN